ncbi:MAG: hypothetical protein ACRC9Q_09545 [Bacteroidales bacterium]
MGANESQTPPSEKSKRSACGFLDHAQVGKLDESNNKIVQIYLKTEDLLLYDVKTERDGESLRLWQSDSFGKDGSNESMLPLFYSIKSDLAKVEGLPNYKSLKYEAVCLMSQEEFRENDELIKEFKYKIYSEIRSHSRSKQMYILTGFMFSMSMILASFVLNLLIHTNIIMVGKDIVYSSMIERQISEHLDVIYLFYAATMGTLGGYFSILRKINNFFLVGENALCGAAILAMSRLLIAMTAGIVGYLIIRAGMYSISVQGAEILSSKSLYLLNAFSFISGFSETLIPDFMQNFEKNSSNQKPKK